MQTGVKNLIIYVTFRCNMSCQHCYTKSGPETDSCVIESQVAEECIQQLSHTGLKTVVLDGGEPMLAPETVRELADYCSNHRIRIVVRTNGSILSESSVLASMRSYDNAYLEVSVGRFHDNESRIADIVERLGELSKRTTLVKYDNRARGTWTEAQKQDAGNNVVLREGNTYRYGRGIALPIHRESRCTMELSICKTAGSHVALCPDGSLWACNGFLIRELYDDKKRNSPLYLGTVATESVETCMDRLRERRFIEIVRGAGHHGLCEILNIKSDSKFEHVCEACRYVMEKEEIVKHLDRSDDCMQQSMRRVEDARRLRQMLTGASEGYDARHM